jgi:site-specific DNA recombinase
VATYSEPKCYRLPRSATQSPGTSGRNFGLEAAKRERDIAIQSLDIEVLRKLAGRKAADRWEAMTVTQRRAVLHTLRLEVVLLPRQKHGPGFERETVRFNWG